MTPAPRHTLRPEYKGENGEIWITEYKRINTQMDLQIDNNELKIVKLRSRSGQSQGQVGVRSSSKLKDLDLGL